MQVDAYVVFWVALGTALATGLGALPLVFARHVANVWIGRGDALAAGLMLGASLGLIVEGGRSGVVATAGGVALGFLLVGFAARLVPGGHPAVQTPPDGQAHHGLVSGAFLVAAMTLHSCAEGIGVGVAFGGGDQLGLLVALAIAVHNIPEGLAISLVLVPRGTSVLRAAGWSIVSSLPQPLLAVPAFLLVDHARSLLPVGFGLAAGAMIWMVYTQLGPEALEQASRRQVVGIAALGAITMLALQLALT